MGRYSVHRKDTTHDAIREAIEAVGGKVLVLGPFDFLIWFRNDLYMIDAKSKGTRKTATQQKLVREGWPLVYAQQPDEALRAIGAMK